MKKLIEIDRQKIAIKAAIFDFDGTISTLRCGWEQVMEPLMTEMISGMANCQNPQTLSMVHEYIRQSTGIQTIYQMIWLAEQVKKAGNNPGAPSDPWCYKAEYNRRLMVSVEQRKERLISGQAKPQDYLVAGSEQFLKRLSDLGIPIYVASGTDHSDVLKEVRVLGLESYFTSIAGAPEGKVGCSKSAVMKRLIEESGYQGSEIFVVGDGKVEIALGRENDTFTLGIASDEVHLRGFNEEKYERLKKAGAHAVIGDFTDIDEICHFFGLY